jgi:hypothetical protein
MTENFKSHHPNWPVMGTDRATGREIIERLGGRDLNKDGTVIDLAIVGSSRFYDFSVIEGHIEDWVEANGYPDLIIIGGASGVDYLAERWADNNNIPIAVFHEQWVGNRGGLVDSGRPEAPNTLTRALVESATHILAFPSQTSKWTQVTCDLAKEMGKPVTISPIEDEIEAS